jgi:hypothetical protein
MPGPEWAGRVVFYEDFPYSLWNGFRHLQDLPPDHLDELPDGISLVAEYIDVSDQVERKISGITLYESQIDRLFGDRKEMAAAVRTRGRELAELGDVHGVAERYWSTTRY